MRALYFRAVKRSFDVVGSLALLILLSPVMLLTAAIVRVTMGAPILFRQRRPGRDAVPFVLLKFRTMRDSGPGGARVADDPARVTRVGRFLRSTSLDELPEFLNVLRGEMSLVGPRPLLMQYLARYTPQQARRHEVKPGITGWAQINGRNALTWDEKFSLDVWYVDNLSFFLDLKILARTAWKVVSRDGISAPGEATMPEFMGSRT